MRRLIVLLGLLAWLGGCATTLNQQQQRTFESYVNLGISYISQSNLTSAESALIRAESISADDYRLTHALALLEQFKGNADKAGELYQKTLDERPDFARARNNYGVFLSTTDRDPEAIVQLGMAANDPDYERRAFAFENLAEVAIKINQPIQAIAALNQAKSIDPTVPRFDLRLAELLTRQDQFPLALENFTSYLAKMSRANRTPTSVDMQLGMAIANHLGRSDLESEYRARKLVFEELEKQEDN